MTGAGLTWTLKRRTNTQLGTSEIWTATASTVLNGVIVTAAQAIGGFDQSLTVVAFRGAGGTGAVAGRERAERRADRLADHDARRVARIRRRQRLEHMPSRARWAPARRWSTSGSTLRLATPSGCSRGRRAVASAGTLVTLERHRADHRHWNFAAIEVLNSTLSQVATPNVVGQTQAAATAAITSAGLTLGTVTTASSTTVPSGSVISQNPAAGTQVATGSAVALVVSTGSPQVAVPNVVGQTQAAATTAITGAGLTLGAVTTASSTTVPAGSVISQNPAAGTQVATGSAVALVVSTGLPQVAVPNVVGLTQAAATTAITGAGLTLGTVTTRIEHDGAGGMVISQNPVAGHAASRPGSAVALVVSTGPPQVAVPNVVGLTQAAATTAITGAGLTVGAVTTAIEHDGARRDR